MLAQRLFSMGPMLIGGALLHAASGCAPLVLSPETPLAVSGVTSPTTLVLSDVASASELARRKDVYAQLGRQLPGEFEKTHLFSQVIAERDLGPAPAGRVYVLHYRVVEDTETFDGAGEALAFIMTWGLVVTIPFSGLVTVADEHRMRIEARLFDVTGIAPTKVRDVVSNEAKMLYDTSNLLPTWKTETTEYLRLSHPILSDPSGQQQAALQTRAAREIAHQIIDQSLPAIQRVVGGPAPTPAPETCVEPAKAI